jgi:L-asparaginase
MTSQHWNQIAADIKTHYDKYDAFIVLHGTDTMAYTAAALSFMLENLNKPVIITGSQLPLCEIRTDARDTLITALLIANNYVVPEVCLYFGHQLLRGNRTRKMSVYSFTAFDSPNFPPLITAGTSFHVNQNLWRKADNKTLKLQTINECKLLYLRLFPGMSVDVLRQILQTPSLQGVVLETFGSGNAPDNNPEFLKLLKTACARGIVILNLTQCLHGSVDMTQYATGGVLADAGLISTFDMTPEAAITKLYYLFSKETSLAKIKQQFQLNLRGEMTIMNY